MVDRPWDPEVFKVTKKLFESCRMIMIMIFLGFQRSFFTAEIKSSSKILKQNLWLSVNSSKIFIKLSENNFFINTLAHNWIQLIYIQTPDWLNLKKHIKIKNKKNHKLLEWIEFNETPRGLINTIAIGFYISNNRSASPALCLLAKIFPLLPPPRPGETRAIKLRPR